MGERHRPEEVVAYMYPEGRTLMELMVEWVKVNRGGECLFVEGKVDMYSSTSTFAFVFL